jgi:hypothetical protein
MQIHPLRQHGESEASQSHGTGTMSWIGIYSSQHASDERVAEGALVTIRDPGFSLLLDSALRRPKVLFGPTR